MSHFLQNLIDRHQEADVNGEVRAIVQPRPKSRFEMNAGSGFFVQNDLNNDYDSTLTSQSNIDGESYLTQHSKDAKPIISAENKKPSQHDFEKPVAESNTSLPMENLDERIKTVTRQPEQKSIEQETSRKITENKNNKQIDRFGENPKLFQHLIQQPQSTSDKINHRIQNSAHQLNSQQSYTENSQERIELPFESVSNVDSNTSTASQFLPRIQTIFRRLNSPQIPHENYQRAVKTPGESASDVDYHVPTQPLSSCSNAIQNYSFMQPTMFRRGKQSEESRSKQQGSGQSGIMQIPGWLTEMQVDLNNRYQQINAKTKPEPVINVTIGRIEVKAIQAESGKTKIRQKPSGVMGLDDYLKQRQSRGRG